MSQEQPPQTQIAFYLLQNGSPIGPYSRDQLHSMLMNGALPPDMLCCENGGAAWRPAGEIFAPAPAASVALALPAGDKRRYRHTGPDQLRWWRVLLGIVALGCMLLPWLRFGTAGVLFQTGVDILKPSISHISPDVPTPGYPQDLPLRPSLHVAAAVILVTLAVAIGGARRWARTAGGLSLTAAALVITQSVAGFPLEQSFMENKHLLSGVGPGLDLKEGGMITREVIESDKIIRSSFAYLEYFRGGWSWGFFGFLTATVLAGLFGITTKRA